MLEGFDDKISLMPFQCLILKFNPNTVIFCSEDILAVQIRCV